MYWLLYRCLLQGLVVVVLVTVLLELDLKWDKISAAVSAQAAVYLVYCLLLLSSTLLAISWDESLWVIRLIHSHMWCRPWHTEVTGLKVARIGVMELSF